MNNDMDLVHKLMNWYTSQCDGDWEHGEGIIITTLDNPGWRLKINLKGTYLEGKPFTEISHLKPDLDWYRCWVENNDFHGAGGPFMLGILLDTFLDWSTLP